MRGVGRREGFGQPRRRLICCFPVATAGAEAIFVFVIEM